MLNILFTSFDFDVLDKFCEIHPKIDKKYATVKIQWVLSILNILWIAVQIILIYKNSKRKHEINYKYKINLKIQCKTNFIVPKSTAWYSCNIYFFLCLCSWHISQDSLQNRHKLRNCRHIVWKYSICKNYVDSSLFRSFEQITL